MQHIITKKTIFPIYQEGKLTEMTADDLLNNIVAILNVSKYRDDNETIKHLNSTIDDMYKQITELQSENTKLQSICDILMKKINGD